MNLTNTVINIHTLTPTTPYTKVNTLSNQLKYCNYLINITFQSIGLLISKPYYHIDSYNNHITINLYYYPKSHLNNLLPFSQDKLQFLLSYLRKYTNSSISLNCTYISRPSYHAHILSQYLSLQSYHYKFLKLCRILQSSTTISSNLPRISRLYSTKLSGIHIRLSGRTFLQKIIPRKTISIFNLGNLNNTNTVINKPYYPSNTNTYKSRSTGVTKRGSYSFSINTNHTTRTC